MDKLTKKYKIVSENGEMLFPVDENRNDLVIFPGVGTKYEEFDTYEEAKAYIDKNKLIYVEPVVEYLPPPISWLSS